MFVPPTAAWKLVLALTLAAAIAVGAFAHAPRRAVAGSELKRLVAAALALYGVGGIASLTHRSALAGLAYAAGIVTCALAVWLSRGSDSEDPPRGDEPLDEEPPPQPDGLPELDWAEFERAFRAYSEGRAREPAGVP
jgi:lysylphosphatidylglycerol synthetase-like protein (DUF2156 family)